MVTKLATEAIWGEVSVQDELIECAQRAVDVGTLICRTQRLCGDFYLKAVLAEVSSVLIASGIELHAKSQRLIWRDLQIKPFPLELGIPSSVEELLKELSGHFQQLIERIRPFEVYSRSRMDWSLTRVLEFLRTRCTDVSATISEWLRVGPSKVNELQSHLGLLRDCEITRTPPGSREKPFWIGEASMVPTIVRAWYLSGNAYLEITTVDIISDLIVQATEETIFDLARDLCFQLADEARHAVMISRHLDTLGFELGCVPSSLHTWDLYKRCRTIPERIVAQNVVQEGVGLDVSVQNVLRMRESGDEACAQMFLRIAADEQNHVALGTKWVKRLAKFEADEIYLRVSELAELHAPPPSLPVIPELRLRAGYPEEWLSREIAKNGSSSLTELVAEYGAEWRTSKNG